MSAVDGRNVITLCDIYHIATDLRHEFERLMASYGPEKFYLLVPPVVQCLELLECQMEAQHRDTAQIQDLRNYVDLLQTEKHSSALLKEKYEKELEACERQWRQEAAQLADSANKLQQQNVKLRSLLTEHSVCTETGPGEAESVVELKQKVETLHETMQKQRSQLRCLQHDVDDKHCSIAAMEQLTDRLVKLNGEVWQRNSQTEMQLERHIDEVVSLEMMLKERDEQLARLKTDEEYSSRTVDEEHQGSMPVSSQSGAGNTVEDGTGNENNAPECMSSECQEMLHRRGLLTLKLSDTADHLDCCHSTDSSPEPRTPPVQGPINKEPDEKLYPDMHRTHPSVIRQMFQQLVDNFEPVVTATKRHSRLLARMT